ncbi:MAG: phosphotransferase [Sandaracinaceae bacterium]|nr:phosphotransferase [Sandaracinaceae bacterium]
MSGTTRMGRYAELVAIGAKHDMGWLFDRIGLGRWLEGAPKGAERAAPMTYAERIRAYFEELGPTYVKLGQILSTRPDLIPREFVEEFKKLQDDVRPIAFDDVKATVEAELGAPLTERFASFDEAPLAAASIGQVHRATLPDGRAVAVKVQRPGIEASIRADLAILYDVARLLGNLSSISDMADPTLIVREFERSILAEVDFTSEARLHDEFRKNLSRFGEEVRIAEVDWDRTTPRVLTMEFFDGVKVSDTQLLDEKGHDRTALAGLITRVTLHSVFNDGLFHADPHPGNLLVLPDGALALIDFGMVGRFDRRTLRMLRGIAFAMSRRDYDALARALLEHGVVDYDVDLRMLARKLRELFRSLSGPGTSMAQQSEALVQFLVQEKLYYQPDLVLLDKTFGTLEGTLRVLCPKLDVAEHFEKFAPELAGNMLSPKEMATDLLGRLLAADDVIIDLPPLTHRVLSRLDAGKLSVRVERRLGRAGVAEVAGLLFASALCVTGLVGAGIAVALRDAGGGELAGLPFGSAIAGALAAAALAGGLASLWRARAA